MCRVGFFLLIALGIGCNTQPARDSNERPNIIVIQVDDLGYNDLGVHGNTWVHTPNLDRMAERSVQYRQFYVNPVCSATRASFLTGRHFLKTGVSHVHGGKDYLHLSEVTLADVLHEAGYRTGTWGKWHVGKTYGYLPRDRGFDESYVADLYQHRNTSGSWNGGRVAHQRWADEVIVDYAIDFIDRSGSQPFFAYLSSMTCHGPLDARQDLIDKYLAKGLSKGLATLYAMVEMLDAEVGRLLAHLEDQGLAEKTIVFFLSDNGPAVNRRELSDKDHDQRRVNPFKGFKGNIWENGVKSPLFVLWPETIAAGISDGLADVTDLFPTITHLAGAKYKHEVDGQVLSTFSQAETQAKLSFNYANPAWPPTGAAWTPEGILDEYRPIQRKELMVEDQIISVRRGDYKLLLNPAVSMNASAAGAPWALYNIKMDPYEEQNLIGKGIPEEAQLIGQLTEWFVDEIQAGDHSFQMPLHWVEKDTAVIYAVGAETISASIVPTFNWLSNWEVPEAFAVYQVQWSETGDYLIEVDHSEVVNVPFSVVIGEVKVPFTLNGRVSGVTVEDIPAGKHTLTLQKQGDGATVERINKLRVIKL